jgi:hypothetical protein
MSQQEEGYFQTQTVRNQTRAARGIGSNRGTFITNYNTNNYFNFTKAIGKSDINATVGMQYQQSTTKTNFVEGLDFPSDSYQQIASAATISGGSSTQSAFSFLSYFLVPTTVRASFQPFQLVGYFLMKNFLEASSRSVS